MPRLRDSRLVKQGSCVSMEAFFWRLWIYGRTAQDRSLVLNVSCAIQQAGAQSHKCKKRRKPLILALRSQRQADLCDNASLLYRVNSKAARATQKKKRRGGGGERRGGGRRRGEEEEEKEKEGVGKRRRKKRREDRKGEEIIYSISKAGDLAWESHCLELMGGDSGAQQALSWPLPSLNDSIKAHTALKTLRPQVRV